MENIWMPLEREKRFFRGDMSILLEVQFAEMCRKAGTDHIALVDIGMKKIKEKLFRK